MFEDKFFSKDIRSYLLESREFVKQVEIKLNEQAKGGAYQSKIKKNEPSNQKQRRNQQKHNIKFRNF